MKWKGQLARLYEQRQNECYICSVFLMILVYKYSQKPLYMVE